MFSMVITTYNRAGLLRLCLEALSLQVDPPDFEVIVVDDGGQDETLWLMQDMGKPFPMRYLWHQKDRFGLSQSRNEGAEIAKHDFIWFLDSDIMLNKNALHEAKKWIETPKPNWPGSEWVLSGAYRFLPGMTMGVQDVRYSWAEIEAHNLPKLRMTQYKPIGEDWREMYLRRGNIVVDLFEEHELEPSWAPLCMLGGSNIFPRDFFHRLGGWDENYRSYGGEDAEMSCRVISDGAPVFYSRKIYGLHQAHPNETGATTEGEMEKRRELAAIYPKLFFEDGTPRTEVWGLPPGQWKENQ